MPRRSQIAEATANLNGGPISMGKVADVTSAHVSNQSSPRSTLAWEDDWRYENEASWISNSISGSSLEPRTPPRESPYRSLSTPSATISPAADRYWRSLPPSPIRTFQNGELSTMVTTKKRVDLEFSHRLKTAWLSNSHRPPSRTSSCTQFSCYNEDEITEPVEESWNINSSNAGNRTLPDNLSDCINALNHELICLNSYSKRAVDLGKKVEGLAAAEILQLQSEKAIAEENTRMFLDLIHELQQQMLALRGGNEKLKVDRQAIQAEKQKLESHRDALVVALRDEQKEREMAQREKDGAVARILEERMNAEAQHDALKVAIRGHRQKLDDMKMQRDAAVKTLLDEKHRMDVERDAMLTAMRDMKTRLEFELDTNVRSMRQPSLDMLIAKMICGDRRHILRVTEKQISGKY